MKTLHHTETTWQGRKIIIDAADLTAEYGYIEVMAMYPDGREIECYHTHDPEDARLMFNHYCDLAAGRPTPAPRRNAAPAQGPSNHGGSLQRDVKPRPDLQAAPRPAQRLETWLCDDGAL